MKRTSLAWLGAGFHGAESSRAQTRWPKPSLQNQAWQAGQEPPAGTFVALRLPLSRYLAAVARSRPRPPPPVEPPARGRGGAASRDILELGRVATLAAAICFSSHSKFPDSSPLRPCGLGGKIQYWFAEEEASTIPEALPPNPGARTRRQSSAPFRHAGGHSRSRQDGQSSRLLWRTGNTS